MNYVKEYVEFFWPTHFGGAFGQFAGLMLPTILGTTPNHKFWMFQLVCFLGVHLLIIIMAFLTQKRWRV